MTNEEFKCWIHGYITLTDEEFIDAKQVNIIRNHANLVKAMMGSLEDSISQFVTNLEQLILENSSIPIAEFKNLHRVMP